MGPPSSLGLRFGSKQYHEQVKIFGNITIEEEIRLMKDFMDSFRTPNASSTPQLKNRARLRCARATSARVALWTC